MDTNPDYDGPRVGSEVRPYRIEVTDAELADLRPRLAQTRWPEPATVPTWDQGVPIEWLRDLCRYWADGYNWRRLEARLNALPQFTTELDTTDVHVIHVRSPRPDALPLIMTHAGPARWWSSST